jgi:hypothetical protein
VRVPDDTKLLGPGHPLFSALIEWSVRGAREAFVKGATIVDPNIARPQRIWLVRSSISDDRREPSPIEVALTSGMRRARRRVRAREIIAGNSAISEQLV